MVMNTGCHVKTDGPLIKDKHTGCLPQEDQVGGFPTNTLAEWEKDPLERIPCWEDYLGPQEDKNHQTLKDQQDL